MTNAAPVIVATRDSSVAGKVLRGLAMVLVVLVFAALHSLGLKYADLRRNDRVVPAEETQ